MYLLSETGHYAFTLFRENALGYVFVKSHTSLKTNIELEPVEGGVLIRSGEHYIYAADEVDNKVRFGSVQQVWQVDNGNLCYQGQYLCVDTTINHVVLGNENRLSLV